MYLRECKRRQADSSVVTYLQLAENVWDAVKRRDRKSVSYTTVGAPTTTKPSSACGGWPRAFCAVAHRKRSQVPEATDAPNPMAKSTYLKPSGINSALTPLCGNTLTHDISDSLSNAPCLPWSPTATVPQIPRSTAMSNGSKKMLTSKGRGTATASALPRHFLQTN